VRLRVRHLTRLTYSEGVTEEVMECRLGPRSDGDQRWERFELRVHPSGHLHPYVDGFGNTSYLATLVQFHEAIELLAQSDVETLLTNPFAPPVVAPRPLSCQERYDYLLPSRLVPAHPELERLVRAEGPSDLEDTFAAVQNLSQLVHGTFTYTPDATTTTSTVEDVLACRAGVCQDFAHVLIGLCRAIGIPARYVSGYVYAGDIKSTAEQPTTSHAWVEAYSPTHGWRGFDPANDILADEHHVKLAVGRDYGDVPPTRGTFRGQAHQDLTVEVSLTARP